MQYQAASDREEVLAVTVEAKQQPGPGGEPTVAALLERARQAEPIDPIQARGLVQQARVLARSNRDAGGESAALCHLAELSYATGSHNEAFAVALEARELAASCGSVRTQVSAMNLIAAVQYHAGNFTEALAAAQGALDLYRGTGERTGEGMLLNSIAVIQHGLEDTDRAIVTYEAALMANKGHDRPDLDAVTLANMAKVRADRHEDLLAVSLGESALGLARDHAPELVPEILARLAMAYTTLSALDRAATCLDEADGALRDRSDRRLFLSPGSQVTVRIARGELYVGQHLRERALREWGEALELAMQANMREVALELRERLAALCKDMGRFDHALAHQEARFALHREMMRQGVELRIRTLQIQHDTHASRQHAEILRLRTTELEQLVSQRTADLEKFQLDALQRVAVMAEFRDIRTHSHPVEVGDLSADIAAEMGLAADHVQRVRMAARLHDIGKVGIPDSLLLKPGALSAEEFAWVRGHTTLGGEILAGSVTPVLQLAAEVALTHHERWDGTGYPRGLAGDEISLEGRIVAVADVYQTLVSERVYKRAWTSLEALHLVVAGHGTRFDPQVVEAFVALMLRRDPSLSAQEQR